jgi:hypothetical protein
MSQSRQNLGQTSGKEGEHQARARQPMRERQTTAWPEQGKDTCSSDIQEREGKGNCPYQGPLGTNKVINGHKEIRVDGRSIGGWAV